MTWSNKFQTDLRNRESLSFLFRLEFPYIKFGVGVPFTIDLNTQDLQIESDSVRINGTSVTNQSFDVTFGQFSINLVGDFRPYREKINKGQIAVLYVGFEGYDPANYQRLIWGMVSNIRKLNFNTFEIEFDDALSSINNRLDTRFDSTLSIHKSQLFYNLGQTTTLTSNFNTGSDTQLNLTDITIFEKDSDTNGLILINDSVHSDPFYVQWTSKTTTTAPAGYLTLTPTGPLTVSYPSLSSVSVPSTIHSATTTVTNAAQIQEFPPHIIGKIIQSKAGGVLNTLPLDWCLGGYLPSDIYDYVDADLQKKYIKAASTTYNWKIAISEPQSEFMRTITDKAAALGQWPVLRQGRISWRGVADPYDGTTPNGLKPIEYDITDDDIISVQSHDFYDPDVNAVYGKFTIIRNQAGNTTTIARTSELETLPAGIDYGSRSDGLTYDPDYLRTNMAVADGARMENYMRLVAEKITLNTHIHLSRFVAGDLVTLSSSVLYGKNEGNTYNNRIGMISRVDIDFGSRSCFVTILFLPRQGFRP
jgi:hypothetical protein